MTTKNKWKVVRIKDINYQRAIKNAKYGDTFDSIFEKLLNERDNSIDKKTN